MPITCDLSEILIVLIGAFLFLSGILCALTDCCLSAMTVLFECSGSQPWFSLSALRYLKHFRLHGSLIRAGYTLIAHDGRSG